jgi:hypothetical protein
MPVTVKDNSVTFENQATQKSNIFLRMFAEEVDRKSEPKTPNDKGNLGRDVVKSVLGLKGQIKWAKKYAAVQERGGRKDGTYRIRNYTTPGTGPNYAKNAVNDTLKEASSIMRKAGLT